ncbi:MAG: hypothetical protein CVU63_22110 [Deltaproteobacteria bacterium HGW-Deltaproteobacteria-20]|nr:MAG: hypothetical protein CVU63_22110 [Deltaproteobacteria bacterium HGW-Deltaproteobacteria-20]
MATLLAASCLPCTACSLLSDFDGLVGAQPGGFSDAAIEAADDASSDVAIDAETCTGCSLCAQLCKPGAISKVGEPVTGGAP